MAVVELKLPHHRYEIQIEPGLLLRLGTLVRQVAPHQQAALVSDDKLTGTHARTAGQSLAQANYKIVQQAVPAGEDHKNLDTVRAIYDTLLAARLERKSPVIALGGGIIGDTVGFAAATYLRGVPFVQCPTTLLAMVDASVGGKVGVNLPQGKNLIGSFHQPALVVIDTDTLATLPRRELRCGLAECVKHAVIRDPRKFEWLQENLDAVMRLDSATVVELVRWNVQVKADVVMADEKETGERAHLNFGHTFGHAIESTQGYGATGGFEHGEAVSLGMVAAARLAAAAGKCPAELPNRLVELLNRIGLPTRAPHLPGNDTLIDAMCMDKKVADGRVRLVLPDRLGAVSIASDVPASAIAAAWDTLRNPRPQTPDPRPKP